MKFSQSHKAEETRFCHAYGTVVQVETFVNSLMLMLRGLSLVISKEDRKSLSSTIIEIEDRTRETKLLLDRLTKIHVPDQMIPLIEYVEDDT